MIPGLVMASDAGAAAWAAWRTGAGISGTCSLTLGGTTTDGTIVYNSGAVSRWFRIGNFVFIQGYIVVTSVTVAATGNLVLRGIPFPLTTASGNGPGGGGSVFRAPIGGIQTLFNFAGDSNIFIGTVGGGTGANTIAAGEYYFNFCYYTP